MTRAAPNHARTSLIMKTELDEKLERVAAETRTSKNAVMTALIAHLSEAELGHIVRVSVESGLINPSVKASPAQKDLLAQIKQMSPEEVAKLHAMIAAGQSA